MVSFLNPWFWLGAVAIAAPLWLHLRRKQQTNLLRFSALRFLEDQPQPRKGPLRLRDLLLFALRVLAVLLIVTAFCWPYLRAAHTVPVRESRVYILDNTLSHQANNGFLHDRDRVIQETSRAATDVQIGVVELTATPRIVVSFSDSRATAQERLAALRPSCQRGSYLAAFRQAGSLLSNSLGSRRRIVFLGDNQENQWTESVNTPPFLRNVQVDCPPPTVRNLPNLSLSEPRIQRIFLGDKSLVHFTLKLSHAGEAKTANLILRANGQVILNRTVDLEKQAQTILLQAQWEADPASWVRGEAVVEGQPDALPADNHLYFSLAPVVEGKVAVLAQSPYLRLALSPDIMRGQWAARVIEPTRLSAEIAANQDADVLCIESNYLQSGDARKLLSRYLASGRGVLLMVNRITPTIKGSLRELGFEAEAADNTGGSEQEEFQFVFSNHPIFHPFLSPDYGNLMEIKVSRYARLRATQAMPLIFSEKGAPLFFQGTKAKGKLFVTAFGLDRESTTWPTHQTFIPFLDLTLQAARAEDPFPTHFEPGEVAILQLPADAAPREVVLRDGQRELLRAPVVLDKAQVRMPDQPGVYALSYDERPQIQKMFSVNPSPKESQLVYSDSGEMVRLWRITQPLPAAAAEVPVSRPGLSAILQQRLWWWMVLGGLLALAVEMLLAETLKERA